MNSCTTRFAFGAWCSPPSGRGSAAPASRRPGRSRRAAAGLPEEIAAQAAAGLPEEVAAESMTVRVDRAHRESGIGSIHEHELVQVQDHPAGVRQAVLPSA